MPLFKLQRKDNPNIRLNRHFMAEPEVGSLHIIEGVEWVYGGLPGRTHTTILRPFEPYPSLRLKGVIGRGDAEHADVEVRGVPHKDVPIIKSRKHERELMAKHGLVRD